MSEKKLIQEIKNNPFLFEKVYNEHYTTIFNYCYKRTKNFDLSKDLTSETFLKAYLNFKTFKWKGVPILSWLYRIAPNEMNLYHRSKKYQPSVLCKIDHRNSLNDQSILDEEKTAAEIEFEKHKQFTDIQKFLSKLPLKYQEVISLKYFENLKIKDISQILNKPEGTVKSLLSRGINQLKNQF